MNQIHKVAIIAGQLVVGGAERQLYLWLSHLDREQFQPVVLTLHPGHGDYWEKPIEDLGITLVGIPQRRNKIFRLIQIIKVLRPYQPDLIHGWHLFASSYAGLCARFLGAKSLAGIRNTITTFKSQIMLSRLTLCTVDSILANSKATAHEITKMWRPRNQLVFIVQNAVEDQSIDRIQMRKRLVREYGLPPDAVWIGSIGRLDPLKRFDLLLKTFSLLKEKDENIHLLLIGDGPEKEKLEILAKDLNLDNFITFTGEVPLASTWLKALDIFCFTSVDEGLPNVIMEAAAAGLPIVTWRYSFIEELLEDRQTALLLEPEDLLGMKNALSELIHAPDLRRKLGDAAQKHILEQFGLAGYIQKMTNVYATVLESKPLSFENNP